MATNPLRKAVATKYGGTTSSVNDTSASKTPTINPVRATLTQKYQTPPEVRGTGVLKDIVAPPPAPMTTITPVATGTLREQLAQKYAKPTPTSQIGMEDAARAKKQGEVGGSIATPEWFATSVDVRSPSGKFIKTFTGKENGEAEALARAEAEKIGGYVQVTPSGGFFGKMFTRAQEAFKGALENVGQKGLEFTQKVLDQKATPVGRVASGVDLGVAGITVLLAPLSAAFSAAEEVPVAGKPVQGVNYIFGKLGEAGGWAADQAVDALPISDKTKAEIKPAAHNLSALLAQLAGGKLGAEATKITINKTADLRTQIKTSMTKDIIETTQLPRTVYVSPEAVKSIFQTGEKISKEELELITALGLDSKGYSAAARDGISIAIPSERIITMVDKPWFAWVKGAFGIKPFSETVVDTAGKPYKGAETRAERLLPGKSDSLPVVPIQPVKTAEFELLTEPISPSLLSRVNSLTPQESVAYGKKIVESINEAVGTKITEGQAKLPENIDVIETPSGDGRPAQFKNGRIQVFLPDLLSDIKLLAEGKEILAHEGEFSTVYKKMEGESMEELSTRYVRDIILHEAAHQKTITLEDTARINNLMSELNAAKLKGNDNAIVAARKNLSEFMRSLETKANAYLKENKALLEKEFLGGPKRETQTEIQRTIAKTVDKKIPARTEVVTTEKKSLIERVKARARGAKEGFSAGKKEGVKEAKTEAKSQHDRAVEKIRDREATVAERKKAAIDYAQILPFRERGKFLKAINNLSSQKEFLDVIDRISRSSKAAERKVLIQKISAELKDTVVKKKDGIPNAKFGLEAQRVLNQMRALQKSMTYPEAQMEIARKVAEWQTENPDGAFPAELLREIEILKTVGIKDQTVAELSYTLDAITSLKETGRTKKEIEIFNRETDIQQKKDKIFDVITGGKPLPSEGLSVRTREKRAGVTQAAKEFLTTQQYGFEEVLDVLSMLDKSSKPYDSFLSRFANDKANDSFNVQNKGELQQIEVLSTKMKEIYGLKDNTSVMQTLGDIKEVVELGDFKHLDGKIRKLELSRGEAMQYHMWMQDETLLPTFQETLFWTPEIMKAVEDFLTPADKKMADWFISEFYPKYYEGINAVYNKEYGVDLPFNPNYSPVHRAIDASIPENVLLAQEAAKYATAKNGSLKDRQNSRIDLKATDVFENAMRHITKMEHYKAWSETMFEFRRIFGDKQVRQAITDIHGKGYMKVLDNFLNDMARDGVAREKVIKAVDTLRSNVTKALLGFNLKVAGKQLTGVLNYGIELPAKDFFGGLADFWKDPLGHANFLYEKSGTLQERFGDGYERDIKFAIQRGYDKRLAKANNWGEVLFIPIRNADKFTVYQGAWATYRSTYLKAKAAGKSDAEAERLGIRDAENITNRVQESSRLDTLSAIQRGGSIAKLFTMLAGQPNKYLRIMANAGRNYKAGRQSGATAMKRIFWAWFVVPFIYNLVADQLIDEKYRETPGGLVIRTLLGPLSYPLITGQLFQSAYGWTQGERFTYQASPVESFMNDLQKAISGFKTDDVVDGVTYMLDVAGKLSGVPSTIITRPIRNAAKEEESSGSSVPAAL